MSRREQSRLVDALPDLVSAILGKVASLAGFALVVILVYFLYALFSGYVAAYPKLVHQAPAQAAKIVGNLQVASMILVAAAVFVVAYTLLYLWEFDKLAPILALIGVALHFGSPFGLAQVLGPAMHGNAAATLLLGTLTRVGQVLLWAAAIHGIPTLLKQLHTGLAGYGVDSVTRRAARKQAGIVHPFSPCWQLPYCRPFIRDRCPRYRERTTCWRKKRGCLCDDDIITAALMGGEKTAAGAKERQILEYLPGAGGGGRSTIGKRLKCKNCFIFLEHQRIKHRYVAPLSVPLVVGAFWFFQETIEQTYASFCQWAARGVQAVAFGQVNTGVLHETFTNPLVKWLFLACIGVYALTYVLRFWEYLFFKLKI